MKIILFAAALTLGSAALAQTGNTVDDPSQSMGPRGVTQQGTDPDGQACTPAGYNANTTGYPTCEAGAGSPASTAAPPRCSKTVKDHCVQAYERGVRR
ncbi:MAG: hypothetical protein ABWX67_12875 [Allosphingosinicella sp.]